MLIREVKKDGFYTNGEVVLFKNKTGKVLCFQDSTNQSELFLAKGNNTAFFNENVEVREVIKNEKIGEINIVSKKIVEITVKNPINAKYDNKGYCVNSKEIKYDVNKVLVNYSEVK